MKKYLFTLLMGIALVFAMGSCDNRSQLEIGVEECNADLPEDMGDGLTMTHVELVGNSVIYTVECDENVLSMEALEENKTELYSGMLEASKEANDEDEKEFIRMIKEENLNVTYKFIGSESRKEVMVTIPASKIPAI